MIHDSLDLDQFDGVVRLFPLPGLVFFPQTVQSLHIFEPRYRQMTADALASDKLISIVMLGDDWEDSYDKKPTIRKVACLGKVIAEQLLPDGRYNLLLKGISRIRILEEIPSDKLYRLARVELMPDEIPNDVEELMHLRSRLADEMVPRFKEEAIRLQVAAMFKGELPLGQLCDILTFALPMPSRHKQELLETTCVLTRARLLLASFNHLVNDQASPKPDSDSGTPPRKFPPEFSPN